jgi:hypothetical protein
MASSEIAINRVGFIIAAIPVPVGMQAIAAR